MVFGPDNLLPELDLDVMYRFDLRSMSRQLIEHSKLDKFFLIASTTRFEIMLSKIDS